MGTKGRGPGKSYVGPRLIAVEFCAGNGGPFPINKRKKREAHALFGCKRFRLHPGRKLICAAGSNGHPVTDAGETDVGASGEHYAERLFAGMFLLFVQSNLDALDLRFELPSQTAVGEAGFEAAIPKDGTRSVRRDGIW